MVVGGSSVAGSPREPGGLGARPAAEGDGRLHIAFFTDSFPPTRDGVATVTESLARSLSELGHRVTVFTVRLGRAPRTERRPDGVRVVRFASVAAPQYPEYRIALAPWTVLASAPHGVDVVHIHTPGFVGLAGRLAARRWRVPSVGTYHTDLVGMLRGVGSHAASRAFYRAWGRFGVDLCRACDVTTIPTEAMRPAFLGRDGSLQDPLVVVENGVDPSRFHPGRADMEWRGRLGIAGAVPVVTFLGRLTRDKGVERFLSAVDALASPRDWMAVVAGVGPLGPRVRERVREARARGRPVVFLGSVDEEDKPALLAGTDVFVLPSLSDTSSVALLEAMASGAACVVTNRGGPAEIARRAQGGVLVDPEDVRGIARAVEGLLAEPDRRRELAERGRRWVIEHATVGTMADRFVAVYRSLQGRRAARTASVMRSPGPP